MASVLACTSRHALLSCRKHASSTLRLVSTSSSKKTAVSTAGQTQPETQPPPRLFYYKVDEPKNRPNRSGQLHLRPETIAKHNDVDPLQHVFAHSSASIVLRDACKCFKCKDPSSTQRNFNVADIPLDIRPSNSAQDENGNWIIRWENDIPGWEDHVSTFTPQQLVRLRSLLQKEHRITTRLWDRNWYATNRYAIDYKDYMESETAFAEAVYNFAKTGLVFIENVPKEEEAVARLAERVTHIKSTFYGRTWDVKSIPNAKNVAYTSKYLGFHSDLMYIKEPPTVQFLHCLENDAVGGESRFVDQYKALDTLLTEDAELGRVLTQTKLRYEYDNDGSYYSDLKPVVQLRTGSQSVPSRRMENARNDQTRDVSRMFWAPPFLGAIMGDYSIRTPTINKSLMAMKKYAGILEREDLVYEEKMIPGTCVMFDNLRVLHARNEFDMNTGKRWLRGTYLDGQDLWSTEFRLRHHMRKFEDPQEKISKRYPQQSTR